MRLATKSECTGCGVCKAVCKKEAIELKENSEGFIEPKIEEDRCVSCSQCEKHCPILNETESCGLRESEFNQTIYAACCLDPDIVKASSSGGIFYTIANYFISNGGVVYGAAWTQDLKVVHIRVDNTQELHKLLKSKYVQSNLNGVYSKIKKDLEQGYQVLFSGTPCQVAAVKSYFGLKRNNLFCIDIVCHGVPSQNLFDEYVRFFNDKYGKIKQYSFREKIEIFGSYGTIIRGEKKKYIRNWRELSYSYLFMNGYISRESCYTCKYSNEHREGDITLGDFWGVKEFHPRFDVDKGASLVMVNTAQGNYILNQIKDSLLIEQSSFEKAAKYNEQIKKPSTRPEEREYLLREWKSKGYRYLYSFYKSKAKGLWRDKLKRTIFFLKKNNKRI